MKIGSDRCAALTASARAKNHEVLTCDNLRLPFRDETFDAVLSIAVIHHFATTDRRVAAIKELTRILRIGGKVLITVWAMEQRHRKFDSQDVLVPWHEPVKSSSEDRGSSVERELTSTTTSDDDVLVYHAYSHISDSESHQQQAAVNRKRQKYRNGRGRYRSAGSVEHCGGAAPNSSQSSSELSSPNETCYSFVRRAFQKLSNNPVTSPYDSFNKKSNPRPYFYRSCRKPCVSESMEFGQNCKDSSSTKKDFFHQDSIESDYPDQPNEDDIPIEIRHLEGYETCKNCGSPTTETGFGNCERHVCTSCLPVDPDSSGKKSRSLGDFFNMIPKLLRVKKCEKEPLSDLHKRISTASDPREYVVKTRGANVNGIVRSKSTVSMMSRLEELMSMSVSNGKEEEETVGNPNCSAGPRSKCKPSRLPSLVSSVLVEGSDGAIVIRDSDTTTNPRRYNSPADALKKLRQDVSLDEPDGEDITVNKYNETNEDCLIEMKLQNREVLKCISKSGTKISDELDKEIESTDTFPETTNRDFRLDQIENAQQLKPENNTVEGHLSSYYSMPELYKLADDQIPEESIFNSQRQKHISFYEQAQNILADSPTGSNDLSSNRNDAALSYTTRERSTAITSQRGFVKRSLSVDTGDNSSSSHQVPRRFSASAAQGVLASALRTYTLPRSCSRGSSVKSDTSVDSEESIVSVIPRKGNSITSDTSVDSEESVISVIQRSTSEIDALNSQNGLRNNISRFGSRSAQASPVTVLSSQTSSAESSPPQSGKNDGRFPGSVGVIDQLMQQQNLVYPQSESIHVKNEVSEHLARTRRCLLRPISDPKLEEKMTSSSEESSSAPISKSPNAPSQIAKFSFGSLESDETINCPEKEHNESKKIPCDLPGSGSKASVPHLDRNFEGEKKDQDEGDLSRTPSPVGPFRYITDPLITGIEVTPVSNGSIQSADGLEELEAKVKSLRFNSKVTTLEENKSKPGIYTFPSNVLGSVLKNVNIKKEDMSRISISSKESAITCNSSTLEEEKSDKNACGTTSTCNKTENELSSNDETTPYEESLKAKTRDSEVRRSLFKLKERLESLTSSQGSIQGFDIFKNVSHTIQGIGSLRNIKEKLETDVSNDMPRENKVSPTSKSLNDSRQSSLDESSQVTLSDESVMSVEGTSSVSDETNDCKRTDEDEENPESQNVSTKKSFERKAVGPSSRTPLNVFTDSCHQVQNHTQNTKSDSCAEQGLPVLHKPSKASFSDTELHAKKSGVRCALRRRLRRSCVTIDEVECRDFISSEDTSPSSSVSLEWNDFDRVETDSSSGAACCSGSITTVTTGSDIQKEEPSIEICCDDVNVAETETKFNVFGDKEMCVFFETPSSSIGKSASSSSNATDFSTTSDRIRGVMQREKSDDRSSKESDSDNLSKLSDVEAKSDSAFSEDFARKTDIASSSSSASLDILDSVRAKLGSDSECEGSSSKQISNWGLDNIDEIPDDDQNHGEEGEDKSPTASSTWKPERSMDFAQRRENFFSCAADCRDMYRISFDDRTKGNKENRNPDLSEPEEKEPSAIGMIIPDLAPDSLELFPPSRKNADDNEAPTDILAAFVETISDITSAFGELYPRQEAKFDDVSSDDSIEISSFERILTSSNPPHANNRKNKSTEQHLDKSKDDGVPEKRDGIKKPSINGSAYNMPNTDVKNSKPELKNNCVGQTFVKLPPESETKPKKDSGKEINSLSSISNKTQNSDRCSKKNSFETSEKKVSKVSDDSITSDANSTGTGKDTKKVPEKLKILNRSSQSVCLERIRQDSFEKDDESSQSTQSAPCSPRIKPRQRSVEEVMSNSRTELSRNSSLSQSTSQESLPGNETGGLMAYHRYYHVFRQGELDNLIESHVENLHILSSYYDHANWCVVAEKVQVWTI
ncbi:putative methyltransferase-like protein, partial [Stegodyphus mimosarum]